jgi:hypothetical protein
MQSSLAQSSSSISSGNLSIAHDENKLEDVDDTLSIAHDKNKLEDVDDELVIGLDDEEKEEYIYLKHPSNLKVWRIVDEAAIYSKLIKTAIIDNVDGDLYGRTELSPLIISEVIKCKTMKLMVSYMYYCYHNKGEKCAPELPLKNIDISYILGDEYDLFTEICDINLPMKEKLIIYNDYIKSATYFGFEYLDKKLCAIVANMFKDLTLSELQQLAST